MLSKLRFFRSHSSTELETLRGSVEPASWAELLDAMPGSLRPLAGGTLNLTFEGRSTDNTPRCFKTHLTEAGRLPLRREAAILQALYGERLEARNVSTPQRDWLVMNVVSPVSPAECNAVDPDWIAAATTKAAAFGSQPPTEDSFSDVIAAAKGALTFLSEAGELSGTLAADLGDDLGHLTERSGLLERCMCHGDLGPRNVMRDGAGIILLDWEDMFHGIRGYDWIYWLSFFANRHLLNRSQLLLSGLSERNCRAILIAILLVKCELALRNGTVAGNAISTEQRLAEAHSQV